EGYKEDATIVMKRVITPLIVLNHEERERRDIAPIWTWSRKNIRKSSRKGTRSIATATTTATVACKWRR
ncbi:hypothetical protein, partial [Enterobacter cloacae complex sp. 4DZ1-17B1]|uniref:hypothetical protein n=1 Tax=Enterobacter cloacae complex sp. 4DZ1-17B1 TaxID=2511991 RepID=UPI002107B618